ncbi:hypothetical protein HK405_003652 [Cladochytrium tenue]|nr:hypothetical protein HK405_003652 [Cladochytrium tenue]
MADLNAKDGNQETVVGLVGMLAGALVVHALQDHSPFWTWLCFTVLTALHLAFNYSGVSAVQLRTLNRQRAHIVVSRFLDTSTGGSSDSGGKVPSTRGTVLSPAQTARLEAIVWPKDDGVRLGASLARVLDAWTGAPEGGSVAPSSFTSLMNAHAGLDHCSALDTRNQRVHVALREGTTARGVMLGYFHALALKQQQRRAGDGNGGRVAQSAEAVRALFDDFVEKARATGWEVDGERDLLLPDQFRFRTKLRQE